MNNFREAKVTSLLPRQKVLACRCGSRWVLEQVEGSVNHVEPLKCLRRRWVSLQPFLMSRVFSSGPAVDR